MQPYQDPDAARDLGLSVIEAEIERLPDHMGEFADRAVDAAERLKIKAMNAPRRPL